jgi:hypothetical protein
VHSDLPAWTDLRLHLYLVTGGEPMSDTMSEPRRLVDVAFATAAPPDEHTNKRVIVEAAADGVNWTAHRPATVPTP